MPPHPPPNPEFSKFRWHEVAIRLTKGIASRVAAVMFDRANPDGTKVYVNNAKLAAELGCNEKSIRRARADIEALGLARLVKKGHNRNSSAMSSEYALTMPSQVDISRESTGHFPPESGGHSGGVRWTSESSQVDILGESGGHGCPPNRPVTRPGNKTGSGKSEPDTEVSGGSNRTSRMSGVASLPVGEGQPGMSDPSPWGSDSATGERTPPSGVREPDIRPMSGVGNQPSIESSEAMKDKFDPWESATGIDDPFASVSATADDEPDYGELYEQYLASAARSEKPAPVPEAMVLHNAACRDAGPWPTEPVDCPACRAELAQH